MKVTKFKCNVCGAETDEPMASLAVKTSVKATEYVMSSHDDGTFHICRCCTRMLQKTFSSADNYYPCGELRN